jgi:hypothetical protein
MKARIARPAFAEASQDFCFCSATPKYSSDPGNCTQKRSGFNNAYNSLIYIDFRRLIWPSRTTVTRKSKRKPPEKLGKTPNRRVARRCRRFRLNPCRQNLKCRDAFRRSQIEGDGTCYENTDCACISERCHRDFSRALGLYMKRCRGSATDLMHYSDFTDLFFICAFHKARIAQQ